MTELNIISIKKSARTVDTGELFDINGKQIEAGRYVFTSTTKLELVSVERNQTVHLEPPELPLMLRE